MGKWRQVMARQLEGTFPGTEITVQRDGGSFVENVTAFQELLSGSGEGKFQGRFYTAYRTTMEETIRLVESLRGPLPVIERHKIEDTVHHWFGWNPDGSEQTTNSGAPV